MFCNPEYVEYFHKVNYIYENVTILPLVSWSLLKIHTNTMAADALAFCVASSTADIYSKNSASNNTFWVTRY